MTATTPTAQNPTPEELAELRSPQMGPKLATAIQAAMDADEGLGTFNPFSGMEPEYHWLRLAYAETALRQTNNEQSQP